MKGLTPNVLVIACGRAENRGMGFNAGRDSVGEDWGEAPVRAEVVTGSLRLASDAWRAWALKPDGSRGREVEPGQADGQKVLHFSPGHGTLCHWLER